MRNKKVFEQPDVNQSTVEELSQKLLEANIKLQKTEAERKKVLENISHDLRAPLTAIRSAVDYLMTKNENGTLNIKTKEVDEVLGLIDSRTRTLEVLIQDLYYLTCLESNRDDFKAKEIPLAQFLEEYFFAVELDEKYKNKKMILNVPEDYGQIVSIDPAKMSRVLDNLFTNARKYSEDGAEIELGVVDVPDKACFYVRDSGYGISEEDLEKIFVRTYKVSASRTPTDEASSGLGLAIVKSVVEQHGGRVWCESRLGEGSSFFVELPIV